MITLYDLSDLYDREEDAEYIDEETFDVLEELLSRTRLPRHARDHHHTPEHATHPPLPF